LDNTGEEEDEAGETWGGNTGEEEEAGAAEVYISPKINNFSRTPKMALHGNPGTPCPWIVIFLHGPKKRKFFCT